MVSEVSVGMRRRRGGNSAVDVSEPVVGRRAAGRSALAWEAIIIGAAARRVVETVLRAMAIRSAASTSLCCRTRGGHGALESSKAKAGWTLDRAH
jgi:hypothetical protein